MGGQGSAKCFPLFEYSILFFSVMEISSSLKSKIFSSHFFPRQNPVRGEEEWGTQ